MYKTLSYCTNLLKTASVVFSVCQSSSTHFTSYCGQANFLTAPSTNTQALNLTNPVGHFLIFLLALLLTYLLQNLTNLQIFRNDCLLPVVTVSSANLRPLWLIILHFFFNILILFYWTLNIRISHGSVLGIFKIFSLYVLFFEGKVENLSI